MMHTVLMGVAVLLLLSVVAGLALIVFTRGRLEVLLAAILFGTTGVALTLVLGRALGMDSAVDVALVFALLAAVLGAVAAMRGWARPDDPGGAQK